MSNFAIRVELRGSPTWETYDKLHAVMARLGFTQTIYGENSDGKQQWFNLPHAIYYGMSASDTGAVRNSVVSAVKAGVQSDIVVFVVEAAHWALGW